MKVFQLIRHEDESGVSGTGKVLSGVCFDDGVTVCHWETKTPSTTIFRTFEEFKAVHIDQHPTNQSEIREINIPFGIHKSHTIDEKIWDVQKATPKYIPAMMKLQKESMPVEYNEKVFHHAIKNNTFVAKKGEEVVGFAYGEIQDGIGKIQSIAVDDKYREKGIGNQLLLTLLKDFDLHGMDEVSLEVRRNNEQAIKFYKKYGFLDNGRIFTYPNGDIGIGMTKSDCVSRKISILAHEHPDWKQDQIIAVANSYCRDSKTKKE